MFKSVLNIIISSLLSVILTLTSLLQYHHHDCDGNIFIPVSSFMELEIGHHHGIGECHHHDHKNSDNETEDNCGLHISDFDFQSVSNHAFKSIYNVADAIIERSNDRILYLSKPTTLKQTIYLIYHPPLPKSHVNFRAPPVVD